MIILILYLLKNGRVAGKGYGCTVCTAFHCQNCISELIETIDTFKCSICRTIVKLPPGSTRRVI